MSIWRYTGSLQRQRSMVISLMGRYAAVHVVSVITQMIANNSAKIGKGKTLFD